MFAVIGLGNAAGAIGILIKSKYQGYINSVFSGALVIWIVVQCIMLNTIHPVHIAYFILGTIESVLSVFIVLKQRLFPANIIIDYYNKASKGA